MDLELNGKNALVTGGERGIGRDICLSLAREGVNIVYCDIKINRGAESTQELVRSLGRKAVGLEVDVATRKKLLN